MAKTKLLAEKMRLLRTSHGKTQEELARILELNRSTYTYYERGTTKPSLESLWRVCTFYRIHGDYFLNSDVPPEDFEQFSMD